MITTQHSLVVEQLKWELEWTEGAIRGSRARLEDETRQINEKIDADIEKAEALRAAIATLEDAA